MGIISANRKVDRDLQSLTTDSWLDRETINKLFRTEGQKKKLVDLRAAIEKATNDNLSAAATWERIGAIKDVAVKLLKKSVGVG